MANLSWAVRRLKAMSIPEVLWRLSQKAEEKKEKLSFEKAAVPVTEKLFSSKLNSLSAQPDRLYLNRSNTHFSQNTAIPLLSGASYAEYRMRWSAGFQTEREWPDQFSYDLAYKQRDEIGDARTNWELNRHFQFALLAKDYAATGNPVFLEELKTLFFDWNQKNPFLHGICWTSVMEVAIRCLNWGYAYGFLAGTEAPEELLKALRIGILNMTDYVSRHYSRFSSANNHLIVEACAIGHSGILFAHRPWIDLAVNILTEELPKQNYSDGVNRELSLHYQSFYLEAMGLMLRLLRKNSLSVPASWPEMLDRMSRFLADCQGDYGEAVVFGDDDEGKILDLSGVCEADGAQEETSHYRYVLGLMSLLLDSRYTELDKLSCETLDWLFTAEERRRAAQKPLYRSPQYCCYREGGNTILRSADRRLLLGIDHAALGFGSICAHAHADALSFQLYYEGAPVFVDPGTYIYHCDLPSRNAFRETRNHNTVCVEGRNQSEMLGAFLWGARAETKLLDYRAEDGSVSLTMSHDGYRPLIHTRELSFNGMDKLQIVDTLSGAAAAEANFMLAPELEVTVREQGFDLACGAFSMSVDCPCQVLFLRDTWYSDRYGQKKPAKAVVARFEDRLVTDIVLHPGRKAEHPLNT